MILSSTRPFRLCAAAAVIGLAACAETGGDAVPTVPSGGPVAGAAIPALVDGGPYEVRIFDGRDAGTVARLNWDFAAGTVSGTYTTAAGENGSFSSPISVQGDLLCVGAEPACHRVYPYGDGFMEVNTDGSVHAVSTPA